MEGSINTNLRLQMDVGQRDETPILYCTQSDNNSIRIIVTLMNKTSLYTVPPGYKVMLNVKKKDSTVCLTELQKDGDNWYFILGGQITTNVGLCKASVEIFKSTGNDDFILNSAPFEIRVRPRTVVDSDIKSESDTSALYTFVANKLASADEFVDKVAQNTTLATNVASNSTLATNVANNTRLVTNVAGNSVLATNVANNATLITNIAESSTLSDNVSKDTTLATNVASNSTLATNVAKDKTLISKVADSLYAYTDFVPCVEEDIKQDSIFLNEIVNAVIEKLQQQ